MKRSFAFVNLILTITLNIYANINLHYDVKFNKNDFRFTNNSKGELAISSHSLNAVYSDIQEYLMPTFPINIGIQENYDLVNANITLTKRLVTSNVSLMKSSEYFTDVSYNGQANNISGLALISCEYPEIFEYLRTDDLGCLKILFFSVTPFIYDASKDLYFIESLGIDIELSESSPTSDALVNVNDLSMVLNLLINKTEANNYINKKAPNRLYSTTDKIEYVIITRRELYDAFRPLALWKKIKGVPSRIYCIEDIEEMYTDKTTQLKLKKFLYNLYKQNSLRYVLLGGDDSIIPTQGCCMSTKYENYTDTDETIPTDLYYACFLGNFEWDANGNNLYGETADKMNLLPLVYVTRAPVRTTSETTSFVNKIISYEKKPVYNNNMLRCGNLISNYLDSGAHSDAEIQSDSLYNKYINPYWKGDCVKFFDTNTDFDNGANYDFSREHLVEQLARGYSFVAINTHGTQTGLIMESGKQYRVSDGEVQCNDGHTIVTTTACDTNAFDTSTKGGTNDPCLSESLLRNPNSGVIAYLGSSRKGYSSKWEDSGYNAVHLLGESDTYEGLFYKYLFSDVESQKSYGEIVANAKYSRSQWNGLTRRIQYALNPMGDPEMPIFINTPKEFTDCKINITSKGIQLNIGESICRICVMSSDDEGMTYYKIYNTYSDSDTDSFMLTEYPNNVSICITKPGYVPKLYKLSFIQNEVLIEDKIYNGNTIYIGSKVNPIEQEGEVTFKTGSITINADDIIIEPETTMAKGVEIIFNTKTK